ASDAVIRLQCTSSRSFPTTAGTPKTRRAATAPATPPSNFRAVRRFTRDAITPPSSIYSVRHSEFCRMPPGDLRMDLPLHRSPHVQDDEHGMRGVMAARCSTQVGPSLKRDRFRVLLDAWRYRGEARDLRLDFLRGLCMVAMVIDHVGAHIGATGSW